MQSLCIGPSHEHAPRVLDRREYLVLLQPARLQGVGSWPRRIHILPSLRLGLEFDGESAGCLEEELGIGVVSSWAWT